MDRPPVGDVEDLATLAKLDETILLEEIKERYLHNKIYTYVGDILIAVNPFKDIDIYGNHFSALYHNVKRSAYPPHIFAVADAAYQALLGHGGRPPGNQCILISGESGAGKTESTKLIIKQLVDLCRGNTQLEQQILQVNPLLEAFGNAHTNLNDNSSRFGKYIQLRFQSSQLVGAKISEYLLEKSRVVRQNSGEENFHIFYYLFASDTNKKLSLGDPSDYRYITHGGNHVKANSASLLKRYEELVNAMDLVGFTDEEQADMFAVIAGVLQLGNITFGVSDSDDTISIADSAVPLRASAELLGIEASHISACLTCMVTVTKGEHVTRNYNKDQAEDARDAMAKNIYGRLFGWIVNKINCLLSHDGEAQSAGFSEIGILDIFGFEDFAKDGGKNSFEQACINLANEQLQFFFNQHIFQMEQEEYQKEGIDWNVIKFVDNKPLLDMFLATPIGVLSLLDEESQFPKGTDQSFVDKLTRALTGNQYFTKSQQTNQAVFSINHYAGKVTYTADKWLEKNRDTLPPGISELLQTSNNVLIKTIFKGYITRTGSLAFHKVDRKSGQKKRNHQTSVNVSEDDAKRKRSVGAQFKNSLKILMERMTAATPIFVRCLKPNHLKQPGDLDSKYVRAQLLYTGMLETVEIRRKGFAVRPTFQNFVEKYKILVNLKMLGTADNCIAILKYANITGWCLGKTKVFLKYSHIERLTELLDKLISAAVQIQKAARGRLARKEFERRKKQAQKEKEAIAMLEQALKSGAKNSVATSTDKATQEQTKKMTTTGTQVKESSRADTKQAAVNWFKETQTNNVTIPEQNRFADWFHGIISRSEAERLLKNKLVGCFLIRVSESRYGYTLSFRAQEKCRHYMIDQLRNGKFIIIGEPKVHRSLHDMVAYHKKTEISNWKNNFLTVPCGQDHGECDYAELISGGASPVQTNKTVQGKGTGNERRSSQPNDKKSPTAHTSSQHKKDISPNATKRPLPKLPEEAYLQLMADKKDDNKTKHHSQRGNDKVLRQ
ncbi:hypothetical protein BsWGS_04851 [Bradybaena similaris]